MRRPRGFADLAGRRVGVIGLGVEGRAALARLRELDCDVVVVDDAGIDGAVALNNEGVALLSTCEVVLKSPGVPRRREEIIELERRGVVVTSALAMWLHDADRSKVIAITGTKGKSTTTTLALHLLRSLGVNAQSAGNIGRPPYEPGFDQGATVVLEVSSFQAVDIETAPAVVVVTSLGADHLDWHGSLERYRSDKLSLTRAPGEHVTLVAHEHGTLEHLAEMGGDVRVVDDDDGGLATSLSLLGHHNVMNAALAIEAVAILTGRSRSEVAAAGRDHASSYEALPGRLTLVARKNNIDYVDDGLATAPLPVIAALATVSDKPLALIVGGYDRGVDYTGLAEALAHRVEPTTLIAMPDAGERIVRTVRERVALAHYDVTTMTEAVRVATDALRGGGVVLMSPGAPSFTSYRNWLERSEDFARCVHAL